MAGKGRCFPPLPPVTGCPLCAVDDPVHIGVQASNLADTVTKVPLGPVGRYAEGESTAAWSIVAGSSTTTAM